VGGGASETAVFRFFSSGPDSGFRDPARNEVRGHTLVWHQQNPKWLTEGKYTSGELALILEKHIKAVVGHYRGRIFAWDVVDEAFDELPRGRVAQHNLAEPAGNRLAGSEVASSYEPPASSAPARSELEARSSKQSDSYIERCFRWAHEADPQALLFYNEPGRRSVNPKSDAIYAMVPRFPATRRPHRRRRASDAHREPAHEMSHLSLPISNA